ncbi:MAG: HAD family hydrolase [Coriobacteriia bacterium]|nr:HAD family hydrolase [Coriobacteriia bacterium]
MLSGILFDLDSTLLDIQLEPFLRNYFAALTPALAEILHDEAESRKGLDALMVSTQAMMQAHPGRTNRQIFNESFAKITGADLSLDHHAEILGRFYAEAFPRLQGTIGPHAGARNVVETALALGLKVAVATNPIFPRAAVLERLRWAGLEHVAFHAITSYESLHSTKPQADYFIETADMLGVDPAHCIMVGDDPLLDMPAADVGMKTYYVGQPPLPAATWHGTLNDLAAILPQLMEHHD